ncbi:MAG: nickel insertion protein, partial [Pseudomonadota bacterium]
PTGDTHYRALRQRIADAPLSTATIKHAHAILHALAAAEASVHGVAIENVHFHELADWDSLMDVVAAGSILGRCAGATFSLSPLPLGSGMVKTQHGRMPVPAPATTILLAGQTVFDDGVPGERVTPTGAAIVSVLPRAPMPLGTVGGQGFGAGTRTLPGIANVLRALVIEPTAQPSFTGDSVAEIAFEVDDMTGEEIAEAATRLRDIAGVVDVTVGSRTGKHGRPVSDFRILTTPAAQAQTAAAVFDQTATIGLRTTQTQRIKLPRADGAVPIDGTPVPAKTVDRPAGPTRKAEARAVTGDTLQERRKLRRAVEDAPC